MIIIYVLKGKNNGNYVMRQANNGRCITSSQSKAEVFDTLLKATNVRDCLPSRMVKKDEYFPVYIGPETVPEEHIEIKDTSSVSSILSQLNESINDFISDNGSYNAKLSEIDQDICDITHYIENCKLNARDGYKAYKMLHDKLQERREIKNYMIEIDILRSLGKKTRKVETKIKGISSREYTPRRLNYLFEKEVTKQ